MSSFDPEAVFDTVLVAIDGSANAARAVDVAAALVHRVGGRLVVVHAVGLLEEGTLHGVAVEDRAAASEDRVHEWCASLRDAAIAHDVVVVPGSPVPALLSVIEERHATLVVVGSRGLGGLGSGRLGSTSEGLVTEAAIPVLVVPSR